MTMRLMIAATLALGTAGCTAEAPKADVKAIEAQAHGGYVAAINSNNVDAVMAMLTDDVVFQSPNEPEIVGKDKVRDWASGYMSAFTTKWEKTSLDFTVSGDWAFERYAYKSSDTNKTTGAVTTDTGKGINIFQKGADGKWRVSRDAWSSNGPPTK